MGQNTFLEVSSTYFHMHWPSTLADEFHALPADQQRPSTFNVTHRHLPRRPRADRTAAARRLPAPDQHRRHALHRRIPRRQPSAEDRLRKLVDADRHRRLRDLRRLAPALHRRGRRCNPTVRTGCVPSEVFLYNTPLTQKTQMRNFAAFVQDRASYQRVTLNLGLRWSYYDGNDPGAVERRRQVVPGDDLSGDHSAVHVEHAGAAHRHRLQADRGRQERREGELQPLLRVDVHERVQQHQPELDPDRRRSDVVVPRRSEQQRQGRRATSSACCSSQFVPRSNSIDPNLKDPKNDEIMFAFQRELANNWSFNVDWIQRWFSDQTTDQNCYGLPCDTVASTVYTPTASSPTSDRTTSAAPATTVR